MQPGGHRTKAGKALVFKLYAEDSSENAIVTRRLQQQWKKIGVDAQVFLQSDADLPTTVANHSYDALLYGISLGVDPDEYVYWHSKQADVRSPSRLNFSEYSSAIGDSALEAGRTRTDLTLRSIKYQPFLQAWQQDAPALGLYQPYFTYVTRGQVYGFSERTLTQATDRFNTVQDWMVRRVPQPIK
jgi:peptide/nickel transport system substrate-binding protein